MKKELGDCTRRFRLFLAFSSSTGGCRRSISWDSTCDQTAKHGADSRPDIQSRVIAWSCDENYVSERCFNPCTVRAECACIAGATAGERVLPGGPAPEATLPLSASNGYWRILSLRMRIQTTYIPAIKQFSVQPASYGLADPMTVAVILLQKPGQRVRIILLS